MSWLRNSSIGASLGKLRGTTSPSKDFDLSACHDSFRKHWQQIDDIICRTQESNKEVKQDDVLAVVSNLDHMVTLLILELKSNQQNNPCLEHVLSGNLLNRLYNWCLSTEKYLTTLRIELLKLYEVLISHSHTQLLVHEAFHRPLLRLLTSCEDAPFFEELEKRLVVLLNQLCVSLVHHQELVQLFFNPGGEADFIVFSLLLTFVHRDGATGQQARDALLLCAGLSRTDERVASFIADRSDVCPVLATGLGGLFSLLPRTLDVPGRLTTDHTNRIPELASFIDSLEFCNAVLHVAHDIIVERLLDYLYQGFLVPVLGPAVLETGAAEASAATAYFDLCLRSLSQPGLLRSFLRLLFKESFDGVLISDVLTERVTSTEPRLALSTLHLCDTLVRLDCEDVMVDLVLKHLVPCSHVMASHKRRIMSTDSYCKAAERFLLLTPTACAIEADMASYFGYLMEAKENIAACQEATSCWRYAYDGDRPCAAEAEATHSLIWADDLSSGYDSFARDADFDSSSSDVPDLSTPVPTVGPFIDALLSSVEDFLRHDISRNLALTGIISRLATYPQPLLRSLLLDHSLVFQPSIKSLFHALGLLKQKVDHILDALPDPEVRAMFAEGHQLLQEREKALADPPLMNNNSDPFCRNDAKRRSISASVTAVFRRNQSPTSSSSASYRYLAKNEDCRKLITSAIILSEWLKELAALAQEHSVIPRVEVSKSLV